ncbi:hypothetical protein HYH02_010093 [Chlamydomonas schloesseri]|uniref:SAM-dependent MTase RsmB/NOP-type domain-containing protein n=1 Tax=Chlamydomonas schloesseri TaxID=2026947 RepID=A0A835W6J0_9CHLO|nr:hypothetical protein HYH02_010093 [Chlamydomonas schloesseri]|eukprot:KAG2441250.1 hypothetical protein HYH02_010093 [Chlamydomonas schloesseri]
MPSCGGRGTAPSVRWDPEVATYFSACFGASRLAAMSSALARPGLTPSLRVNTLTSRPQDVVRRLTDMQEQSEREESERRRRLASVVSPPAGSELAPAEVSTTITVASAMQTAVVEGDAAAASGGGSDDGWRRPAPRRHRLLRDAVILSGRGPREVSYTQGMKEAVVNRFAAEAVLKGAHVYAPGLLAASPGIVEGDWVAVSAALERPAPQLGWGRQRQRQQQQPAGNSSSCGSSTAAGAGTAAAGGAVVATAEEGPEEGPEEGAEEGVPSAALTDADALATAADAAEAGLDADADPVGWSGSSSSDVVGSSSTEGGSSSGSSSKGRKSKSARRRLVVGIARGTPVGPDGRVELAWAKQLQRRPGAEGRGREVGSSTASNGVSSSSTDGPIAFAGSVTASTGAPSATAAEAEAAGDVADEEHCYSRPAERLYLGVARAAGGRRALFRSSTGLVLQMQDRLYDVPSCNGLLRGEVMLQALPSIAAVAALTGSSSTSCSSSSSSSSSSSTGSSSPAELPRGARVLDMCAAPGGKSTALAAAVAAVGGRVVALDRTHNKIREITSLAADLGVTPWLEAYKHDATQVVAAAVAHDGAAVARDHAAVAAPVNTEAAAAAADGQAAASAPDAADAATPPLGPPLGPPPYPPATFDAVLLDPPCSALGLRPRLLHSWTLPQLRALAAYQRSLIVAAVAALRPGGTLVYCTCTVSPPENEANVAWALDRYAGVLQLESAQPLLGLPGLTGADPVTGERWLRPEEAEMVQRFDPGLLLPGRRMRQQQGKEEEGGARSQEAGTEGRQAQQLAPSSDTCAAGAEEAAAEEQQQQQQEEEEEEGDDVMGFFIARFRKVR